MGRDRNNAGSVEVTGKLLLMTPVACAGDLVRLRMVGSVIIAGDTGLLSERKTALTAREGK